MATKTVVINGETYKKVSKKATSKKKSAKSKKTKDGLSSFKDWAGKHGLEIKAINPISYKTKNGWKQGHLAETEKGGVKGRVFVFSAFFKGAGKCQNLEWQFKKE